MTHAASLPGAPAIVDANHDDPALAEFMTELGNTGNYPFLPAVEPWVAPADNPAEKLLREPVVLRKIRGALRSVAAVTAFCALMSCRAVWKMHGLRPLAEIRCVPDPSAPHRARIGLLARYPPACDRLLTHTAHALQRRRPDHTPQILNQPV